MACVRLQCRCRLTIAQPHRSPCDFPPPSRSRCRALDCLLDMPSNIPYASLFPYKKTVAKALMVRGLLRRLTFENQTLLVFQAARAGPHASAATAGAQEARGAAEGGGGTQCVAVHVDVNNTHDALLSASLTLADH